MKNSSNWFKLFILGIFFTTKISFGVTYYFSNSGNDLNIGTDSLFPFQTITKLNSLSLLPADSILFKSGDIFRGEIDLNYSGTTAQPIYFGKYSAGNFPVISGAELTSIWTNVSGNIYQCNAAVVKNIFMNGKEMTLSRFPNTGYLVGNSVPNDTTIIDSSLNQSANFWNGATIIIRTDDKHIEQGSVDSFSNFKLSLNNTTVGLLNNGDNYFLENLFSLVDSSFEWFYDGANNLLYLQAPNGVNPNTQQMETVAYDNGMVFNSGVQNIVVTNLTFNFQADCGIKIKNGATEILIQNSQFNACSKFGIYAEGANQNIVVTNNFFSNIDGSAVQFNSGNLISIQQNKILRTGINAGYGLNHLSQGNAIHIAGCDSVSILQNTIDSSGNCALFLDAIHAVVVKNIFNHSMLLLNDNGGITISSALAQNSLVKNNFVLNTEGTLEGLSNGKIKASGIFSDYRCRRYDFLQNTIANSGYAGIAISDSNYQNKIVNNTVYDAAFSPINISQTLDGSIHSNSIKKNVFYSIKENEYSMNLQSLNTNFSPGIFDSNYYYNPYNQMDMFTLYSNIDSVFYAYSLARWIKNFQLDSNSKTSFVKWSRFIPVDTTNSEIIFNSSFTNNTNGWGSFPLSNNTLLLDNLTQMDDGCFKIVMTSDSPSNFTTCFNINFSADSSNYYLIRFSAYGIKDGDLVINLNESATPYSPLTNYQLFQITPVRQEFSAILKPEISFTPTRLNFFLPNSDSIVWLDNIHLHPVSVTYNDPHIYNRLFMNMSDTVRTFDLLDSIYLDLDSNVISTSLTLQPWSSQILLWGNSAIPSSVSSNENSTTVNVFPNPVCSGGNVFVDFPTEIKNEKIQLLDLTGKIICEEKLQNSALFKIPDNVSSGIYLLRISGEQLTAVKKLFVLHDN